MDFDTICAPATSPVNSALSIIRISGSGSLPAACSVFKGFGKIEHRKSVYGSLYDQDKLIDDVLLTYFKGPNSFTGEDIVEISCHGNPLIVQKILHLFFRYDIRMAEPGEFSRRAFINGKTDLTEAEAINQIINARSDWEIDASLKQMHGALKNVIRDVRKKVIHLKADVECGIDFLQEDIEFVSNKGLLRQIESLRGDIISLLGRCKTGSKLSHGIDIPIVGKPNVGKSSILNFLINAERAIVSDIPGTTRDMIRETVQFAGVHVNFIDTAGIHESQDTIEKIGIERSLSAINDSVFAFVVFDASSEIDSKDKQIIEALDEKQAVILLNKSDLETKLSIEKICKLFKNESKVKIINFSAKTGDGLFELEETVKNLINFNYDSFRDSFIADVRVINLLEKSVKMCESVQTAAEINEPHEILAFELQQLIDSLSEITGDISPDDVLDSVFSRFCIGK